jgi:hypothetical protein
VGRQIVPQLAHRLDRFVIHAPRRPTTGAQGLNAVTAVDSGERLGHLAAI